MDGVAISYFYSPYMLNKGVVDAFDSMKAKTTFFVNGPISVAGLDPSCIYDVDRVADLRYAYEHGHTIGAGSWEHIDISALGNYGLSSQLDLLETALWKILGMYVKLSSQLPLLNHNHLTSISHSSANLHCFTRH